MENYPNVHAVVTSIADGNTDIQLKWRRHTISCIKPALEYYSGHLKADLMSIPLQAFKAARLFSPHNLQKIKPECTSLISLLVFLFITPSNLTELKEEFPKYIALTEEVSSEYTILYFWKDHAAAIPKWSDAARKILLVQPSSAAAERVFSLLNNSFGDQQLSSLEDYLEASVMMQYKYNKNN